MIQTNGILFWTLEINGNDWAGIYLDNSSLDKPIDTIYAECYFQTIHNHDIFIGVTKWTREKNGDEYFMYRSILKSTYKYKHSYYKIEQRSFI